MYVNDYDDYYPNIWWVRGVNPYINPEEKVNPKFAHCPSVAGFDLYLTYAYPGVYYETNTLYFGRGGNESQKNYHVRTPEIKASHEKALLSESFDFEMAAGQSRHNWMESTDWLNNRVMRRIHGNGGNVLFVPGNVEWIDLGEGDHYVAISEWQSAPLNRIWRVETSDSWK
jgi:prepilin-type processing-associated H-X9-DG protein